ncbi:MAG TPA: hypothetical protein VJ553_00570 [Candidatus Paceibacterota bacterium]|nr:hypothetical protein [Candidatus Paceibacterota bacterium]
MVTPTRTRMNLIGYAMAAQQRARRIPRDLRDRTSYAENTYRTDARDTYATLRDLDTHCATIDSSWKGSAMDGTTHNGATHDYGETVHGSTPADFTPPGGIPVVSKGIRAIIRATEIVREQAKQDPPAGPKPRIGGSPADRRPTNDRRSSGQTDRRT